MVDQAALVSAFADYARTLAGPYEIGDVLYRLTDHTVAVLGADGAGVSLADEDGVLRFVTATDERIVRVEERQVRVSEGPCQDAYLSGDLVTSADLAAEPRWPNYTTVAQLHGCQAVAGIPMAAADRCIGALNLYSRSPREWPADEIEVAQVLADMATGYVLNARIITEGQRLTERLQHALDSRVVIEQAKGVLAERHRTDPASAFARLRDHARAHRCRLHDIARAVVDGELTL